MLPSFVVQITEAKLQGAGIELKLKTESNTVILPQVEFSVLLLSPIGAWPRVGDKFVVNFSE